MTHSNDVDIIYRPSLMARVARYVLPIMKRALPPRAYDRLYGWLYRAYRWAQRQGYRLHLLAAALSGDDDRKLRAQLTWKTLPYTMGGYKALENAFDLVARVERDGVQGALVECGVAEGGTSAMMALASRKLGSQSREKWLFDSYEGMPEATIEDYQEGARGFFIRSLDKGTCLGTIEQVSELMFDTLGFDRSEVHLVKGWFQDTVPQFRSQIDRIAVLRLDGDWYESTKIPLENFYEKISEGGFVIFDDYATCFGSRKATDEFRERNAIVSPLHEDGRGGAWFEKSSTAK